MSRYANATTVSPEKSRGELERILRRYGADSFGYMAGPDRTVVAFRAANRNVRFELRMPDPEAREFTHTAERGLRRNRDHQLREWEQACWQRWRALTLVVKAKLEAVDAGIATFEEEFLPYIALPDGRTVAEHALPLIEQAYANRVMPAFRLELPAGTTPA